jgi:hypothetical protein
LERAKTCVVFGVSKPVADTGSCVGERHEEDELEGELSEVREEIVGEEDESQTKEGDQSQ